MICGFYFYVRLCLLTTTYDLQVFDPNGYKCYLCALFKSLIPNNTNIHNDSDYREDVKQGTSNVKVERYYFCY